MGRKIGGMFRSTRRGTVSGVAFDPANLTNFLAAYDMKGTRGNLWQNTARTTPATAANDPVAVIDEWTGSTTRRLVNGGSTDRPTILASNAGLSFDGVNDYMLAASFGAGTVSETYLCMRWKLPAAPPSSNGRILAYGSTGASDFSSGALWWYGTGNASALDMIRSLAVGSADTDLYSSSTAFDTWITTEMMATTSGNAELAINGTSVGTVAKNSTAQTMDRFAIACATLTLSNSGRLAASRLIVTKTIPDAANRLLARTWVES